MRGRWLRMGAIALLLVVLASGCGGVYDATVTGTVTLDGAPVPRGTIAYHPTSGGPTAYAPIAENGFYTIRTGREKGLPSGEYQVTVTANEVPVQLESKDGGPPPPGKPITPRWYRNKQASGLQFQVEPGGNEINLELSSDPPAGYTSPGRR